MKEIVLDTETTGLSTKKSVRIIKNKILKNERSNSRH